MRVSAVNGTFHIAFFGRFDLGKSFLQAMIKDFISPHVHLFTILYVSD